MFITNYNDSKVVHKILIKYILINKNVKNKTYGIMKKQKGFNYDKKTFLQWRYINS